MIKCGADEHRRRGLDRGEPLFSALQKMQTSPCAPARKHRNCGITITVFSAIFAFGELYWLRQLYLLRKLYCPLGSFGGEYNITAA